ncbi:hypothetical protein EYC98_15410 [Halieaceae bacterium IMCC14734]|uniref:DUF1214 domain-containing protein n=1 Tax=Candidatus Litorirhabdus singularis TaxID=2518993 RepID=A0ABT3TJS2_9GAMM|nr:hypothetical protein [Candidatus Litorirhabdus singularis]MCX2982249.1 hypothetical protein [Candidatus Litorirhabdus singularis]
MTEIEATQQARDELRSAWDDLIGELQSARNAIDDPAYFPPSASPRVLAEGYRYLAGFVHHGIERAFHEDVNFPAFRNALSIFNKSTIDNSDAIYFYAAIDGRQRYLIKGNAGDFSHWRGEPRSAGGGKAPQYLIFESASGPMAGDTGNLAELMPGFRTGFGTLDSSRLQVAGNGDFEVLLAPERPQSYEGNFICTSKPPRGDAEDDEPRYADYVSGRQLFYDWENEDPIHLSITPLDNIGEHPPAQTPEQSAAQLRRMGAVVRGQMHFWLNFYDKVLNCNGSHENVNNSPYFMPVNAYNTPNAASADTGGGMSTNIYAGGIFELEPDEALYVEASFSGDPIYSSMHLGNLWGESPDYANHQSSLNLAQMHMGDDSIQRWVVAHRDPGVQNWIDTTGLPSGYLSHRWAYPELPPKADWPTISCRKVAFADIQDCFPDDMPVLTLEQRRQVIGVRQAHVQRRFRVF